MVVFPQQIKVDNYKSHLCVHTTKHSLTHQQADRGEADVQLLVLQAKAAGYIHYNLKAGARHGGQKVCDHQLQALEGCSDQ